METSSRPKPIALYLLQFLLLFLALGGFYGGLMLVLDPSGNSIQFPPDTIERLPFPDYLIPGIILILGMSALPLLTVYGLWIKPEWPWTRYLNIYPDQHWAWTFALYNGIVLAIWINVQIWITGSIGQIQPFYGLYAVALIICSLLPGVMKYYRL